MEEGSAGWAARVLDVQPVREGGPAAAAGHVYQYTASLYNTNGQIASIKQSEPFILL